MNVQVLSHPVAVVIAQGSERVQVLVAEDVDEELAQFVGAGRHLFGAHRERVIPEAAGHVGVLMAHRADAGAGRGDDRLASVREDPLEDLDVVGDDRQRILLIAGVDVHLSATGLLRREDHLVPEPLEQQRRRLRHPREEHVTETGDEQPDAHTPNLVARPTSCPTRFGPVFL